MPIFCSSVFPSAGPRRQLCEALDCTFRTNLFQSSPVFISEEHAVVLKRPSVYLIIDQVNEAGGETRTTNRNSLEVRKIFLLGGGGLVVEVLA